MRSGKTIIELFEEAKTGNLVPVFELISLSSESPANSDALTTLGTCYFYGYAVEQDYKKAFEAYEKSANLGCDLAKFSLGVLFQQGLSVTQNFQSAVHWYFEAAKGITARTINSNKAIQQLEILANAPHNNNHALTALGSCYYQGYGVSQNYSKAFEYYSKAAQSNYDLSMYNLGLLFEQGLGMDPNPLTAESWYKKSLQFRTPETVAVNLSEDRLKLITAEKKIEFINRKYAGKNLHEEAQKENKEAVAALEILANGPPFNRVYLTTLGTCYYSGWGTPQDYKKARDIYEKAAQAGCDIAMYSLGVMYGNGLGVNVDIKKSVEYFLESLKNISPATLSKNKSQEELSKLMSFVTYLQRKTKNLNFPEIRLPEKKVVESNFDDQVIIDFMHPDFFSLIAKNLAGKWNSSKNTPCHILRGSDLLDKTEELNKLKNKDANRIRIYVIGHAWVSYNELEDDNNKKYPLDKIAEALAYFIKDHNVVINLVACCAGKGKEANQKDSVGAKLHAALYKLTQRDIPVIARTSLMTVFSVDNRKGTFKISRLEDFKANYDDLLKQPEWKKTLFNDGFYINKQPGSKLIFKLDEKNQQICRDVYKEKWNNSLEVWKRNTVDLLSRAEIQVGMSEQKKIITDWIVLLNSAQEEKVYQMMKRELDDTKSLFREKALISRFFKSEVDVGKIVSDVVADGRSLFEGGELRLAAFPPS